MTRRPRDIASSVYNRLLQRSRSRGEDFQLTLQRYAVERFLCRLQASPYQGRFILKGAMLYLLWGGEAYRPTRDLDLLAYLPAEEEPVATCFRALCSVKIADDGLRFLPDTLRVEEIRERGEYGGIRIHLEARLTNARIKLQVDLGFGDKIVPDPEELEFPSLLDGPSPRIRAYSRESVIAEKLHAAVLLGDANSRMKDFYDLFTLPRLYPFVGATLTKAIAATFERRRTSLPPSFPFRAAFFDQETRADLWRAYLARTGLDSASRDFTVIGEALHGFLAQPYDALVARTEFLAAWGPGGPWR